MEECFGLRNGSKRGEKGKERGKREKNRAVVVCARLKPTQVAKQDYQ